MIADPLAGFHWTTPFIADACVHLALPLRLAPQALRPIVAGTRIAGRACPARHAGSVDVFLEAIDQAAPGDVLVIDNTGRLDEACIGDLVAAEAKAAGLAGLVVWGAHRDTEAIAVIGVPVWSLGTFPAGPQELRTRSPHALEAASLSHVTVTKEDVVFADIDGVIVIAAAELPRVISSAREIASREQAQSSRLSNGERLRDQLRLREYVARRSTHQSHTFREHLKGIDGAIES